MTTAFQPAAPKPMSNAAIVVIGVSFAGFLVLAGITLFSLSLALPIALIVAETASAYVSPSDIEIARQLGAFAPAFVVAAVASLIAALAIILKLIQRVSPAE